MTTQIAEPEVVPSGFHHADHRRVGGMSRKSDDGRKSTAETSAMIGRVFEQRSSRAAAIAEAIPEMRAAKKVTACSHAGAKPTQRKTVAKALEPTAERSAKGDMVVSGGVHRSAAPIEKLRKSGDLDRDEKTANGMFWAAEKLARHYLGHINGSRALDTVDLDADVAGGYSSLSGEEGWVRHYDEFKKARTLLGFYPDRPELGCANIVIAVVCKEMSLREAAEMYLLPQRTDRAQAVAMDRLRSGLLSLAFHWGFL